jgi:hypothetical protein
MKALKRSLSVAALVAGGMIATVPAQAWWGGGPWGGSPWSGSDTMGWGDIDTSFRTTGWGRSQYQPWYGAPYGGYGGYPGYGYGAPYGGYPYGGAPRGAPPTAPAGGGGY